MPTAAHLLAIVALSAFPATLRAQSATDPHAAKPERPTVATHAWTVAPAYAEIEAGVEWDDSRDGTHQLSTPTLVKFGLTARTQLGVQAQLDRGTGSRLGLGDVVLVLKHRLSDHLPLMGAFAIIPALKLPTGASAYGTGTTDVSLVLVSSHDLGDVSIDVNLGYTRRFGAAARAPREATMWTVSAGLPLAGSLGLTAEVFGFPATRGLAGLPGTVALLAGPTLVIRPWCVVDLGGIVHLTGPQPDALYAGVVYNVGRVF
jgi:hypothetical protein